MKKLYQMFEHTADLRVRIRGRTLKDLFRNAGLAIFQITAEKQAAKYKKIRLIPVKIRSADKEELLVNWLNELISLSQAKGLIFERVKIKKINNSLEADIFGADIRNYRVNVELKAATYHALKLQKNKTGWMLEVIFDV